MFHGRSFVGFGNLRQEGVVLLYDTHVQYDRYVWI